LSCVLRTPLVPTPDLHSFPTRRSSDLSQFVIHNLPQAAYTASHLDDCVNTLSNPLHESINSSYQTIAYHHLMSLVRLLYLCVKSDRQRTRLKSSHVSISYAVF